MEHMPRFWQVCASVSFVTPDGWEHHRTAIPTFALISAVQGIRNEDDAKRVARAIVLSSIGTDVTGVCVSVSVLPFD